MSDSIGKNTIEEHRKNEKERWVPFSISPFKKDESDTEAPEKSNPWLELSGDLVWTATFSSLTSNNKVTGHSKVSSYAVYFALVWHLWATQVSYDVRYYTNDWYHRIAFLVRLSVYAALAAFSASFDVFWQIAHTNEDGFIGDGTDDATALAIAVNTEKTDVRAFKIVNLVLMASRVLLLLSYIRVHIYRCRATPKWKWSHLLVPFSLLVAAILFLLAFILVDVAPPSKRVAIGQFVLWGLAVGVQILANIFNPEEDEVRRNDPIEPRLQALTVIILGEGLNGICGTLNMSLGRLGLSSSTLGDGIALAFIIYFIWLLYFDGFQVVKSPGPKLEASWMWMHLLFHLCLILLLEGLKNVYLYTTLAQAIHFFDTTFIRWWINRNPTDAKALEKICLLQGQSWDAIVAKWEKTMAKNRTEAALDEYTWWIGSIHDIFQLYQEDQDDKAESMYTDYTTNSTLLLEDAEDPNHPVWYGIVERYNTVTNYSAHWVLGVGGLVLICLAILNIMHRRPRDQYVSLYAFIRLVCGIALGIATFTVKSWPVSAVPWFIGTIAVVLAAAAILDQLVIYLSANASKKPEDELESNAAPAFPVPQLEASSPVDEKRPPYVRDGTSYAKSDSGSSDQGIRSSMPPLSKHPIS